MESFYNKLKAKSDWQLQQMITNKDRFNEKAVNIAAEIIDERKRSPIYEEDRVAVKEPVSVRPHSFDLKPFIRSFSYRDLLTATSLAFFFLTFSEMLSYYSNERILEGKATTLIMIGLIILMLTTHVLYRIEHGRSNNFIGRLAHDAIVVILLVAVRCGYSFVLESISWVEMDGDSEDIFSLLLGFIIIIFLVESLVALLKAVLRLFKWQIF